MGRQDSCSHNSNKDFCIALPFFPKYGSFCFILLQKGSTLEYVKKREKKMMYPFEPKAKMKFLEHIKVKLEKTVPF